MPHPLPNPAHSPPCHRTRDTLGNRRRDMWSWHLAWQGAHATVPAFGELLLRVGVTAESACGPDKDTFLRAAEAGSGF